MEIDTDLGTWTVHQTPGHAPSHVCLFQRERRLLISADHLLGRVPLYYDFGWTPDPVGEFLQSLDVVRQLDARLCLPGHGRPFADVPGHIGANRTVMRERLEGVLVALDGEPGIAAELVPELYGEPLTDTNAGWLLAQTLCYLRHLELDRHVTPEPDGSAGRWRPI